MHKLLGILALLLAVVLALWFGTRARTAAPEAYAESGQSHEMAPEAPELDRVTPETETDTSTADRSVVETEVASVEVAPGGSPRLAEIRGRFLLPGGAPAVGVQLEVHGWESNQEDVIKFGRPEHWEDPKGSTGDDGRFSLRFDPPRAYQFVLDAKLEGWCRVNWRWGDIEPESTVEVGDVELVRGGSIRGRIVDAQGQPLSGDWMVYGDGGTPVKATDPSGGRDSSRVMAPADPSTAEFLLEDVPPGRVGLKAYSRMANWIEGPGVDVRAGEEVRADIAYTGPDNRSRIVVRTLCQDFYVFGHDPEEILLTAPGQGARKAAKIERSSQSFSFDDVVPGSYTVEVRDPLFQPWSKSGVRPGATVEADLKGNAAVTLQVVDDISGAPIGGFALDVRFEEANFSPNVFRVLEAGSPQPAGGRFDGFIPRNQTLIVRADGYAPCEVALPDLSAGETRPVIARVGRGKTLIGRTVVGSRKKPVAGSRVALLPGPRIQGHSVFVRGERDPDAKSIESDAEGRFRFAELSPGVLQLRARLGESLIVERQVTIPEKGDPEEIELVLPEHGWLAGKLTGPPAGSFEGLMIIATPPRRESGERDPWLNLRTPETPVEHDGTFRCGPLPAGEIEVTLRLPDIEFPSINSSMSMEGASRGLGTVTLAPDVDTKKEFDVGSMFPGSIHLRVRLDGAPAASALVYLVHAEQGATIATVQLDANGEGMSGPVFPGPHRLYCGPADRSWMHLASVQAFVQTGIRTEIEFDIQLFRGVLQLKDAKSGQPLAMTAFAVALDGMRESQLTVRGLTNNEGKVDLRLPAGRFMIATGEMAGFFDPTSSGAFDWTSSGPAPQELAIEPSQFPR